MKKEALQVRIPKTLKLAIVRDARESGKSISTILREILEAKYFPPAPSKEASR